MIIAMETATTHEARARNAKAQALAAVLLERGATNADVKALHAATPVFWEMAAFLATERELMGRTASGKVRQVHVPGYGSGDATATINAVARILGDLIAHADEQDAIAEAVAPVDPDTMKARTTAGLVFDHRTHGTMTVVKQSATDPRYVLARKGDNQPGRAIPIRKSEMRTLAQASAGYRATLATGRRWPGSPPTPETTEADLTAQAFAAFAQADRR